MYIFLKWQETIKFLSSAIIVLAGTLLLSRLVQTSTFQNCLELMYMSFFEELYLQKNKTLLSEVIAEDGF